MNCTTLVTLLLAFLLTVGSTATSAQSANDLFQKALAAERADGNLREAIRLYEQVATQSRDRALAARALVRAAECYQKLGDAQARNLYERIVRDYADQPDALVVARSRLGTSIAPRPAAGVNVRRVWAGNRDGDGGGLQLAGQVSRDGRFLTYAGGFNTTIVLRDLATGSERVLASRELLRDDGGTGISAFSPDGTRVAHDWCKGASSGQRTCSIRIVDVSPARTGSPQSRQLLSAHDVDGIAALTWSADGRTLAVGLKRQDHTAQVGLVDVQDGSLRVLKSLDWRGPSNIAFSPDGRSVAYDVPAADTTNKRDIYVLAADGSAEIPAVVHASHDVVLGWTPDGRHLLFASDRSGSMDLWALEFVSGRPGAAPKLLYSNIGTYESRGITASGALHFSKWSEPNDIEIVSIDPATGMANGPATRPLQRFVGSNGHPAWSPDGRSLGYVSDREEGLLIGILSMETGEARELQPQPALDWIQGLSWMPDGRALVASATDVRGGNGVFRIDAQTGAATVLFQVSRLKLPYDGYFFSPDGRWMYYHERNSDRGIIARDLATGEERVVVSGTTGPFSLSPDGQWIARSEDVSGTALKNFVVIPTGGGPARELLRLRAGEWINNIAMPWTPDSRGVIVRKMLDPDGKRSELWLLPVDGSAARRIAFDADQMIPYAQGRMKLHPDGLRLAFVGGPGAFEEVWVLENLQVR